MATTAIARQDGSSTWLVREDLSATRMPGWRRRCRPVHFCKPCRCRRRPCHCERPLPPRPVNCPGFVLNRYLTLGDAISVYDGNTQIDGTGSFIGATCDVLQWADSTGNVRFQVLSDAVNVVKVS
ncbi:MAG: hypothetical protein OWT27_07805 [Firmicutes bacterium]|nr:hypothetical protein [Bacillota bacterium]